MDFLNGFPHADRIIGEVIKDYLKTLEEINMKKIIAGILALTLVLSLGIGSAFAAGTGAGNTFVDADGDGVCDNCGTGAGRGFRGGRGR